MSALAGSAPLAAADGTSTGAPASACSQVVAPVASDAVPSTAVIEHAVARFQRTVERVMAKQPRRFAGWTPPDWAGFSALQGLMRGDDPVAASSAANTLWAQLAAEEARFAVAAPRSRPGQRVHMASVALRAIREARHASPYAGIGGFPVESRAEQRIIKLAEAMQIDRAISEVGNGVPTPRVARLLARKALPATEGQPEARGVLLDIVRRATGGELPGGVRDLGVHLRTLPTTTASLSPSGRSILAPILSTGPGLVWTAPKITDAGQVPFFLQRFDPTTYRGWEDGQYVNPLFRAAGQTWTQLTESGAAQTGLEVPLAFQRGVSTSAARTFTQVWGDSVGVHVNLQDASDNMPTATPTLYLSQPVRPWQGQDGDLSVSFTMKAPVVKADKPRGLFASPKTFSYVMFYLGIRDASRPDGVNGRVSYGIRLTDARANIGPDLHYDEGTNSMIVSESLQKDGARFGRPGPYSSEFHAGGWTDNRFFDWRISRDELSAAIAELNASLPRGHELSTNADDWVVESLGFNPELGIRDEVKSQPRETWPETAVGMSYGGLSLATGCK